MLCSAGRLTKKVMFPLLCLILIITAAGCSSKPGKKELKNYIGEGLMTNIRMLIGNNERLAGEVFVYSHLPTKAGTEIEKDGKTYVQVVSDEYRTYQQLYDIVTATYTKETAEKLFEKYDFYKDINGILYFEKDKEFEKSASPVWNTEKIKTVSADGNKYILKLPYTVDKKTKTAEIEVVLEDGNPRLTDVYTG